MELRQLGATDVKVSPVIFGAWAIGGWMWGGSEESDSIAAIHASLDEGINTIDTAAIYGMGYSEELVAKAIKGRRDKVVIATKCGMRWTGEEGVEPWKQKDNEGRELTIRKNAKPDSIEYECEQSLKRLGVETIDLYQIHWPDSSTPGEESIGAMEKLRKAGKIRAIGVSNYDAMFLARAANVATIASNQPPYSIIQRKIEAETLPFARSHNIGTICYSPMERGLLTGKVTMDRKFPAGDHRAEHKFFAPESRRRVLDSLEQIKPIAEKHGASLAQLIINWTTVQPGITAAIVGARDADQARQNAQSLRFTLSDAEVQQIRQAFDQTSRTLMSL